MAHTVSIPIHKIIDLIQDYMDTKKYKYADEDGLIEIYNFDNGNAYDVKYSQFMYGKIYTKQFTIYKLQFMARANEEYRNLYFERSILTSSLRGRKKLTFKEKEEKFKYIEYLKTGEGVNIEELESIYY